MGNRLRVMYVARATDVLQKWGHSWLAGRDGMSIGTKGSDSLSFVCKLRRACKQRCTRAGGRVENASKYRLSPRFIL